MRMGGSVKIEKHHRVTIQQAKHRALVYLATKRPGELINAASVGSAIWPDNNLRAQGLGLAASKTLRILQDERLVKWDVVEYGKRKDWGYKITSTGRQCVKDVVKFPRK